MVQLLIDSPLLLLFLVLAVGYGIGNIRIFGSRLGVAAVLFVGLGFGALQLDQARKGLAKAMKKELVKHLPKVADQQWQPIYDGIQECFDSYEQQVIERVNEDINSRKAELDNLVRQKQTSEVNRDAEVQRLTSIQAEINQVSQRLESAYQSLLMTE